ncbi:component of SufBCD complex [Rhodovulum sulfidophilum]|uniref:Component of SufBCD complex n=1 Tax=Rhodovulum visakhapatnamense TaxID=364297 RepID=A0ABS1RGZ7_9RHOB|nr:component of SufBCD complex [Rhodovulum visakhapatnamense]MBL3578794.1 component of SufBCD complex [Rhodovulum visakhapatnamense]OLS45494.1 component of SufBCD complex [Rhodovulum sulfidophilum]
MDLYGRVFDLIDMRSFSNLWYWIALAVLWSTSSHWVLGVPFDLIQRARRRGGQAAEDVATLVGVNARRYLYIASEAGLWIAAFTGFALAVLFVLGFGYGVEFCQAVFLLVAPTTLVGLWSVRTAHRYAKRAPSGEALYRMLRWHRLGVQAMGIVSVFVTAMWGMWMNMVVTGL